MKQKQLFITGKEKNLTGATLGQKRKESQTVIGTFQHLKSEGGSK